MKGILILFLILIKSQVASDIILKKELIGTWKIEKVQVIRPSICVQNDFSRIVGINFVFEEQQQLLVISNNDWFQLPNEEEIRWYLEDEHLSNLNAIHLIRISKK